MDPRDRARGNRWYSSFNQKEMTVEAELYDDEGEKYMVTFPVEFAVCGLCSGNGSHVNPSIDAHGIGSEEFAEDPDFAEDYFNGAYDVPYYECKGIRVVPEIVNEKSLTEEQKKNYALLQEKWEDEAYSAAEYEAERRMGA